MTTKNQFLKNRTRLAEAVGDGLVVVSGFDAVQRTNDMPYPFQQESHFWWLTGISEPGWAMIFDTRRNKTTLVKPSKSEIEELFDGGLSVSEARDISAADDVILQKDMNDHLRNLASSRGIVYGLQFSGREKMNFALNPAPGRMWSTLDRIFNGIRSCDRTIEQLRAIKQPYELAAIQRAIDLTAEAFTTVKAKLSEYAYEYQVQADFSHAFMHHNAGYAYDPIIASEKNACTLHYVANNAALTNDAMVLMDVGAQVDGYCADITRTYQVGTASDRAKDVYQAVAAAHKAIIASIKPDMDIHSYQECVDDEIKRALCELGLMKDMSDTSAYRRYFPHAISHGLGIDVHDSLGRPRTFKAGMVLTVEPGIYVPEENIGVRIEDVVQVTPTGVRNMSGHLSTDW